MVPTVLIVDDNVHFTECIEILVEKLHFVVAGIAG